MLMDMVQFCGDDVTDNQQKSCPICFLDLRAIRSIRVIKNAAGCDVLVIDGFAWEFKDVPRAVAKAKALADLVGESTEDSQRELSEMYAQNAGRVMKGIIKDTEDKG